MASARSFSTNNVQLLDVDKSVLAGGLSDPDGDALSVQLASGPSNGVLVLNSDGSFQYAANAGFVGEDRFTIRAFDGELFSAPVTVSIVVTLPPVDPSSASSPAVPRLPAVVAQAPTAPAVHLAPIAL